MDVDEMLGQVLSLPSPWRVAGAELFEDERLVEVQATHDGKRAACPKCGVESSKYDAKPRRWRHLDLCEYKTWITCSVPRVDCAEHGVLQVEVPWSDGWSRFTARFECSVIDVAVA